MVVSFILFVLFIIIYIIISDIITVFFRLTGLTEEKARFQVVSLLTNSGFTTRESESVVSSRIRRRLARATMLFGYIFTITIVSTTVNFFMSLSKNEIESVLFILPIVLTLALCFHYIHRSHFFKTMFDSWIERLGNRIMFGIYSNPVVLVEDYGDMVVAQIYLHQVPHVLEGVPLSESVLMSKYNIMVMMVKNKNGEALQANADTVLKSEDIIMVLGKRKNVREVFERIDAKDVVHP